MKKALRLWIGSFNFSHELVTKHTWAPTWASAKNRMLRRIAADHGVDFGVVYGMFDGTKDNFTVEMEVKENVLHERVSHSRNHHGGNGNLYGRISGDRV